MQPSHGLLDFCCTTSIKCLLHKQNLANYICLLDRTQVICARKNGQRALKSYKNGVRVRPQRLPFSIFAKLRFCATHRWFT